jgi:hypothetical protein
MLERPYDPCRGHSRSDTSYGEPASQRRGPERPIGFCRTQPPRHATVQARRCRFPQRLHTPTPGLPADPRAGSPASTMAGTPTCVRIPHRQPTAAGTNRTLPGEGGAVTPGRARHHMDVLEQPGRLLDRHERRVVVGRMAYGELWGVTPARSPRSPSAPGLHRLGQRRRVEQGVVPTLKSEPLANGVSPSPVRCPTAPRAGRSARPPARGMGCRMPRAPVRTSPCRAHVRPVPLTSRRPGPPASRVAGVPESCRCHQGASRIVVVSRARPASVVQVSVGPGKPSPSPTTSTWSERKNAGKPHASAFRGDG